MRKAGKTRQGPGRQLPDEGSRAARHRLELRSADGKVINLAESPLARLAVAAGGEAAFLEPHQVEAGERVRRLVERAQLQPRLTMVYDAHPLAGGGAGTRQEIGDMAADARRALAEIARLLPRDCADVLFDVCGLLKGLQQVEAERGWPRRSAKLVLRIGLDQLARHYGFAASATGRDHAGLAAWRDGPRPDQFG